MQSNLTELAFQLLRRIPHVLRLLEDCLANFYVPFAGESRRIIVLVHVAAAMATVRRKLSLLHCLFCGVLERKRASRNNYRAN